MSASEPPPPAHDAELSRFLDEVVELSASGRARGPDLFLEDLEALGARFEALQKYRTDKAVLQRLEAFARERFALVDEPSEYALAGDEVLVLSMALGKWAHLSVPALARAVELSSGVLAQAGVPAVFGQLLERLRHLARQQGDSERLTWVQGVISALPGD